MSSDAGEIQRRYREFLDLLPLTLSLAGLPCSEGRLFNEEQIEAVIQALDDTDPSVRTEAITSLGRYGPAAERSIPALLAKALHDPTTEARVQAIVALAAIGEGPSVVVPVLVSLLRGGNHRVRVEAARALRAFGPAGKEALPVLLDSLGEREELVEEILLTLGTMGTAAAEAEPALREFLRSHDCLLREEARTALQKIMGEETAS